MPIISYIITEKQINVSVDDTYKHNNIQMLVFLQQSSIFQWNACTCIMHIAWILIENCPILTTLQNATLRVARAPPQIVDHFATSLHCSRQAVLKIDDRNVY